MKTVYLHIGLHKTGTTAIQDVLKKNKQALATKGYLIPETGYVWGAHYQLSWALLEDNPSWYPVARQSPESLYAKLRNEIKKSSCQKIILSSEEFSFLGVKSDESMLEELKHLLGNVDVKIVVFLRDQAAYADSFFHEEVKSFSERFDCSSLDAFVDGIKGLLDYKLVLNRWEKVFGKHNLIVKTYGDGKHGAPFDSVREFFDTIGVHMDFEESTISNPRMDVEHAAIKKIINASQVPADVKVAVGSVLQKVSTGPAAKAFSLAEADRFMARYRESNRQVASRYGLDVCALDNDGSSFPEKLESPDTSSTVMAARIDNALLVGALKVEMQKQMENERDQIWSRREDIYHRLGGVTNEQEALKVFQRAAFRRYWRNYLPGRLNQWVRLIEDSGIFDKEYYIRNSTRLSRRGRANPIRHYLMVGARKGRDPSADFSTVGYLENNADVAMNGINPLLHYVTVGRNEGRLIKKIKHGGEHNPRSVLESQDSGRHIVFMDHEIPRYDESGGARHAYHYLKLFRNLGWKVTFLPYVNSNPNPEHKRALESEGIRMPQLPEHLAWVKKDRWRAWFDENAEHIDVVCIHRPHVASEYIPYCKELGIDAWYMCQDLHYLRLVRQAKYEKSLRQLMLAVKLYFIEKKLFHLADASFTPSVHEKDLIRKRFGLGNIAAVPVYIIDDVEESDRSKPDNKDLVFVGSFAHQPNVDGLKWFLKEVFPEVRRAEPHVRFHVVGKSPPAEITALAGEGVQFHGFVTDEELERLLDQAYLMVAPLRFGAGVKGKVLDALRKGIPLVSTSCGLEGIDNLDDDLGGKDTAEAFAGGILHLFDLDDAQYRNMSGRLKSLVRSAFSSRAAIEAIESVCHFTLTEPGRKKERN